MAKRPPKRETHQSPPVPTACRTTRSTNVARRQATRAAATKYSSITWGEFKALVERQGVTDRDNIFLIDVGPEKLPLFVSLDAYGVEITDYQPTTGLD